MITAKLRSTFASSAYGLQLSKALVRLVNRESDEEDAQDGAYNLVPLFNRSTRRERSDGWMEVEMGSFYNGDVEALFFEIWPFEWKRVHFTVERKTVFPIDALDMSKLSLFDEDRPLPLTNGIEALDCSEAAPSRPRSVSKRSSDRSETRLRCCSVGASAIVGRAQL
nr:putative F-box protein PP2-B12 isoform X4 [Ipomoea trifida]